MTWLNLSDAGHGQACALGYHHGAPRNTHVVVHVYMYTGCTPGCTPGYTCSSTHHRHPSPSLWADRGRSSSTRSVYLLACGVVLVAPCADDLQPRCRRLPSILPHTASDTGGGLCQSRVGVDTRTSDTKPHDGDYRSF
eukprot:2001201-Rhodomonas_salina.3